MTTTIEAGRKGGYRRAERLSPERRKQISIEANRAKEIKRAKALAALKLIERDEGIKD